MSKRIKVIMFFCLGIIILVLIFFLFSERVSSASLSFTRLLMLKTQIQEYEKNEKKLPDDLSYLPKREGYDNSTKDGWGNEIIYTISPEGNVSLISLGRDGKTGGTGENADISMSFEIKSGD